MVGVGYRFVPTEEELLKILKNRSIGIPPPCEVVEKNLYGADSTPWKLLDDAEAWRVVVDSSSSKASPNAAVIYAITELSKVGNGGKNRTRTAGCGTWHGPSKPKSIKNWMGQEIGTMRTLNFVSKTEMRDHWIMHEYALSGALLGRGTKSDYVICRITRRVDESEAKFQGCGKRKAVLDGTQENQVPAVSDDQESQHSIKKIKSSGSIEQEDGDERAQGWFLDMHEFDTAITCVEETGGAAVNQQYQNSFEWVKAGENYQNVGEEIGAAGASDQQQHQDFEWVEVAQHFQNVAQHFQGNSDQRHQNFQWAQIGQDFENVTWSSD